LIDLDLLVEQGLLERAEIDVCNWGEDPKWVDFGLLYINRMRVLRLAYGRFEQWDELERFCRKNDSWLPDFTLFMALKEERNGAPWYSWEQPLKFREPEAMWQARKRLKNEIRFYCFVQYLFHEQWNALREYAHAAGISIIGDVPIYVPYDSADVWSSPEWFQLDETLTPVAVAGCPPDGFNEDGQLWGNPLYCWDAHKKDGYNWWLRRLCGAAERYDVIRIDHFRGFAGYFAVPFGAENARNGQWLPGPGLDFIQKVKETGILDAIRGEDGCIRYDYYLSEKDPNELLLIEQWETKEHQQIHLSQPHMDTLRSFKGEYIETTTIGEFKLI
jgi:4-alpha-glucanotransferase